MAKWVIDRTINLDELKTKKLLNILTNSSSLSEYEIEDMMKQEGIVKSSSKDGFLRRRWYTYLRSYGLYGDSDVTEIGKYYESGILTLDELSLIHLIKKRNKINDDEYISPFKIILEVFNKLIEKYGILDAYLMNKEFSSIIVNAESEDCENIDRIMEEIYDSRIRGIKLDEEETQHADIYFNLLASTGMFKKINSKLYINSTNIDLFNYIRCFFLSEESNYIENIRIIDGAFIKFIKDINLQNLNKEDTIIYKSDEELSLDGNILYKYIFEGSLPRVQDEKYIEINKRNTNAYKILEDYGLYKENEFDNRGIYNNFKKYTGIIIAKLLISRDPQKIVIAKALLGYINKKENKNGRVLEDNIHYESNKKGDIQFMKLKNLIEKFDKTYESTYKTDDEELRLEFIKQFPIESLENLELERYALGKQPNNMCWWLEFHTVPLGSIKGGTSKKFKIYYSNKDGKWIYPNYFSNVEEAWIELRKSIFNFVNNFRIGKYELLDDNSMISSMNMFKTKLLYMYFPEKLLPVYSLDHIKKLLKYFGYKDNSTRELNIVKANMELKKIQSNIEEFKNWDGLKFMRFIYSEIVPLFSEVSEESEDNLSKHDYEDSLEVINKVQNYIQNEGYNYTHEQLSNLYLSLKTKPFVILAGISGTGKSKIVRLMSQAIGAEFNQISIRPDWNDSTDLIGYKNLEDKFIQGHLTKIIVEASKEENKNKPYFVCLDEMNLARVEYYLSDYLSIIESRQKIEDEIITDNIVEEETIKLHIPDNLYIIGTVNMDDTTFQFSRKVLDRANTIEFSDVDLENLFPEEAQEEQEALQVDNNFLKTSYLKTIDIEQEYREYAKTINKKIIEINEILKISQKQFAYRVRDEIIFYMIENKKAQLLEDDLAFDYQIMQKILPAIVGSEYSVCEVLINLFNFVCDKKVIEEIDIEEAENYIKNENIRYENSAKKILYMLKGYQNDGYCSYWY